ncbi:ABC transporter permease [Dactylosporangium sp. NPDC051541]|uniref:ABC transporter permease n=1 Tax=Dactylosporangium sp. NPDC051541 TaxID=3363977 RepID=UPI0037AA3EC3
MSTVLRAVRAEWTKATSTPGPVWLLVVTVAVTVGLGAVLAGVTKCGAAGCGVDVARVVFSGVYLGQAPVAVLAVLVVSGEFSTSLIRTTLAAMPRRSVVLVAKAVVLGVAVAAVAGVAVLGSVLVASIVLPGNGFTGEHGYVGGSVGGSGMVRAAVGTVGYLVLVALLSLGVAAVVRDSGGAIGAVLGLLYLPPLLAQMVTNERLHRLLEQGAPMSAGLAVQATTDLGQLPIGPWAGLGVLAVWAGGALVAGGLALRARDT